MALWWVAGEECRRAAQAREEMQGEGSGRGEQGGGSVLDGAHLSTIRSGIHLHG